MMIKKIKFDYKFKNFMYYILFILKILILNQFYGLS